MSGKDEFLTQFYSEYNDITEKISSLTKITNPADAQKKLQLSADYERLSNRTAALQKYLTENTKFIPVYETRKAQENLSKLARLSQDKRDEVFPKKKFGFKSKQKMTTLADAITTANTKDEQITEARKKDTQDNDEMFFKDSTCTIKDVDGQTVIKYGAETDGKDIAILNIKNACIQIYGNPSVLHAKNIENSVILCGPISGSAFVNNLKNVKLVIACHQLRIHESHQSEFYIHIGSRAIIENCTSVQFAPYAWTHAELNADFARSTLNIEQSNWECIDDFNWLNQNQESPNWSILDEEKRLNWVTKETGELINT